MAHPTLVWLLAQPHYIYLIPKVYKRSYQPGEGDAGFKKVK